MERKRSSEGWPRRRLLCGGFGVKFSRGGPGYGGRLRPTPLGDPMFWLPPQYLGGLSASRSPSEIGVTVRTMTRAGLPHIFFRPNG
jgi:hypothetical protein